MNPNCLFFKLAFKDTSELKMNVTMVRVLFFFNILEPQQHLFVEVET